MLSGGVSLLNCKPELFRWSSTVIPSEHRSDLIRIEAHLDGQLWSEFSALAAGMESSELQVAAGNELAVFIRVSRSASESRILVARPESDRLVCSCALSLAAYRALLVAVEEKNVEFHRLGRLHFLSNLEMVWKTV
jgi:hypothetical protein